MVAKRVSLIIPIFNESNETLIELNEWIQVYCPAEVERIIVTAEEDRINSNTHSLPAISVTTTRGRARQMNFGAQMASGEILVFLHADTHLESSWYTELTTVALSKASIWGAFTPKIAARGLIYRCAEFWGITRSRLLGIPYGDQTIFISNSLFENAGKFDETVNFMEELDLASRLNRQSHFPIILSSEATTSNRRWIENGLLFYSLRNLLLFALFLIGVPRCRLGSWYHSFKLNEKPKGGNRSKE